MNCLVEAHQSSPTDDALACFKEALQFLCLKKIR